MRTTPLLLMVLAGCTPSSPPAVPEIPPAEKIEVPGIMNAFRVTPRLYSGSTPESESGFAALQKLGIRTIISVDGRTPDVEAARRHGMRCVHEPIAYRGMATTAAYRLAKAVQTLPGPFFIHCHRGRDRGPAAIAAVRLCLEPEYSPYSARAWLAQAGTDGRYHGLLNLPLLLQRPTAEQLAEIPATFPEAAAVSGLAKAMANIDWHWEAVTSAQANAWLGGDSAAGLLVDDFRVAQRQLAAAIHGRDFDRMMAEAESTAEELAQTLQQGNAKNAGEAYRKLQALCGQCHSSFRD